MSRLEFAVVIITRNRPTILDQCLQALAAQTLPPAEVVIIDSSESFTARRTPENWRHLHFPSGRKQMPLARNRGIEVTSAPFVAFIDDDCIVAADWLEQLAKTYQHEPDYAGVGGLIIDPRWTFDPDRPVGQVDPSGRVTSNFFGDPGSPVEVQILPGGNMSFRRDCLLAVGGFDPSYIATNHREDPDLCLRLADAGFRLGYQAKAEALHLNARNKLGELTRWDEFYLRYSFGRNEGFFLARHFPKAVMGRWLQDTFQQSIRALKARSLADLLCTGIQGLSFGLGLLSHKIWGQAPSSSGLRQLRCRF